MEHDFHGEHAHVRELEKKITALSDALAHLGRGTTLQELLKIIRFPGWTTPAELGFVHMILDQGVAQVAALEKMQEQLVEVSRKVSHR